jgi:Uma2 family endonuclease
MALDKPEPRQYPPEVMSSAERELEIHGRSGEGVRVPPSAWTHSGFRAWVLSDDFPENGLRATFTDGEVLLDMSPEEIESHNKIKSELVRVVYGLVKQEALGEAFSDGVLLSNIDARLSCELDMAFVSWASLDGGHARYTKKANRHDRYVEIEGTPDMVVEVVSDSSVRKDLKLLREAYFRAGIPEYWLIDGRRADLHFEILHRTDLGYRASAPDDQPQQSQIFGRTFSLTRSFNPRGRFVYDLTVVAR